MSGGAMKRVFIVAVAERQGSEVIDLSPEYAESSAVVDSFELLFPLMNDWVAKHGTEFTAYAMPWTEENGTLTPGYQEEWDLFAYMYRLDRTRGGNVKVSDYTGTLHSNARPVKSTGGSNA